MANSFLKVTDEDILNLRQKLINAFGEGYEVEINKEVSALMGAVKEIFDLVVYYHGDAICGVEYKYKAAGSIIYDRFQDLLISKFKKVGLKYGFAYTGSHGIYFWAKDSYGLENYTLDNIVAAIKGNQTCGKRVLPSVITEEFMRFIPEGLNDVIGSERINRLQSLYTEENLEYEEKSASIWFKADVEDEFFRILLHNKDNEDISKRLCRYTTLNSLFLTMKDGNNVMCSITCMNDKGETSYADKYVGYGSYATSTESTKENNDCFILSCCEVNMLDNLTMWRLYGNDGKGVCLEYEVDMSKIDNKEFFFAPVSYGVSMNNHPSLEYIKQIRHWKNNGWSFELKRWYIWKHFFKSHLFKEEHEVRLLYVWKDNCPDIVEWIMDTSNNIASRLCKFPINDGRFPLTLKKAIIGPKCPEQGSNVDQFNYMNNQTKTMPDNWFTPAVRASKIEDYR